MCHPARLTSSARTLPKTSHTTGKMEQKYCMLMTPGSRTAVLKLWQSNFVAGTFGSCAGAQSAPAVVGLQRLGRGIARLQCRVPEGVRGSGTWQSEVLAHMAHGISDDLTTSGTCLRRRFLILSDPLPTRQFTRPSASAIAGDFCWILDWASRFELRIASISIT